MEPTNDVTVDELVERLRERVTERRRLGQYPPDLEADLDAHFERIVAHRPSDYEVNNIRNRIITLDKHLAFNPATISYDSSVPGGEALHRMVSKIVSRQTAGILEQVNDFALAVRATLVELIDMVQHPHSHVHPDLLGQIDALLERVASYERMPSDSSLALADVRRRVDALEAADEVDRVRPLFQGHAFEERFRGSQEELRERYETLAQGFVGCGPVVDLGCGRGEFLELLRKFDVESIGVEIDTPLVAEASDRGLSVEHGDAIAWLAAREPESLGGVALIQVAEHLSPQDLVDLVTLAGRKLRVGGKIVIETPNPQSLYIFARAFYVDPTHNNPVHPAYLTFLLEEAGFRESVIEWRSPPPTSEVLEHVDAPEGTAAALNANFDRLNQLLFAAQDYAIIATR